MASGPGGITFVKPAGATTDATVRQLSQQLADDLAASYPLGLTIGSRLDYPTSGVLRVALGSESTLAANWLQAQWQQMQPIAVLPEVISYTAHLSSMPCVSSASLGACSSRRASLALPVALASPLRAFVNELHGRGRATGTDLSFGRHSVGSGARSRRGPCEQRSGGRVRQR